MDSASEPASARASAISSRIDEPLRAAVRRDRPQLEQLRAEQASVMAPREIQARIRAGATLVQLYSALVYEGPGLARRIARGLSELLARDGFANVADAIGSG